MCEYENRTAFTRNLFWFTVYVRVRLQVGARARVGAPNREDRDPMTAWEASRETNYATSGFHNYASLTRPDPLSQATLRVHTYGALNCSLRLVLGSTRVGERVQAAGCCGVSLRHPVFSPVIARERPYERGV